MWVFVRNFSRQYWVIAPRAPHSTQPFGYSWRRAPSEDSGRPTLEDLRPSVNALVGLVEAYAAQNSVEVSDFDLIGFSQGAALANTFALLHPERVGRIGILAGFMPFGSESRVRTRPLNGKPFYVAHGRMDDKVPLEYARESVKLLESAGALVTFCEDAVAHKLSANCLRELEQFFAR